MTHKHIALANHVCITLSYLPPPRSPIPPTNRLFSSSLSSSSFFPLNSPWILLMVKFQFFGSLDSGSKKAAAFTMSERQVFSCLKNTGSFWWYLIILDPNTVDALSFACLCSSCDGGFLCVVSCVSYCSPFPFRLSFSSGFRFVRRTTARPTMIFILHSRGWAHCDFVTSLT